MWRFSLSLLHITCRKKFPNMTRYVRRHTPAPRMERFYTFDTGLTPPGQVICILFISVIKLKQIHLNDCLFCEYFLFLLELKLSLSLSVDFFTAEGEPKSMSGVSTGLHEEVLQHISQIASSVPLEGFHIHPGECSCFVLENRAVIKTDADDSSPTDMICCARNLYNDRRAHITAGYGIHTAQ